MRCLIGPSLYAYALKTDLKKKKKKTQKMYPDAKYDQGILLLGEQLSHAVIQKPKEVSSIPQDAVYI